MVKTQMPNILDMNIPADEELRKLLLGLIDGSESAFNALYALYSKPLYRKILQVVKDGAVAEELLQDLFLKLWQKRNTINPDLSFNAYVYTIVNNLVYDYLRKVSHDKRLIARLILDSVDHYLHSEEQLSAKETSKAIQEAISKLTQQQQQVFTLCKIEGKSYEEAGRILGISTATVNSHIVNSKRYIKAYLEKNLELTLTIIILSAFK